MTRARDLADSADKDIAGTLTLDGLTVDGNVTFGTGSEELFKFQGGSSNSIIDVRNNNRLRIKTGTEDSELNRLDIENNGDISFYDTSGTTAKLFWDASEEKLGLGTSSPSNVIETDVSDATVYDGSASLVSASSLRINNSSSTTGCYSALKLDSTNVNGTVGQWRIASISTSTNYDNDLAFHTRTGSSTYAERMRLNNAGKLSLGTDLTNADNSLLHLTTGSADNFSLLQLESTDGGTSTGPDIAFYRNSASPADGDNIGALHFYGNNSVGDRTIMGQFYNRIVDVTDGSEDSKFDMYAMQAGSLAQFLTVGSNASGTGEVCVNEGSADINFRVETDANANAFVVDAGANFIGMHTGSALAPNGYTEQVRINSDGSNLGGSLVMSANNGGRTGNSAENDIVFYDQDAATANQQAIGNIRWYGLDPSGAGEGYKIGIKGRAQADGGGFLEFYASSTSTNYTKVATASTSSLAAGADNVRDLGSSGTRWDDVYATNGTIQTSDERLKQQVASLTTDEINAAKAISALFKTYKWNDKVAAKGDNARIHSGVIAQQVKSAMENNNLDPMKYAFFCWNEYYEIEVSGEDIATPYMETFEVDDPEIPEGATYVDRYSIRYGELMSFIHAATEQRLASIETRLDALEAE